MVNWFLFLHGVKTSIETENSFSTNGAGINGHPHLKRKKLDFSLTKNTKINMSHRSKFKRKNSKTLTQKYKSKFV